MLILDGGDLVDSESQCSGSVAALAKMGYLAVNAGATELRFLDSFRKALAKEKLVGLGDLATPVPEIRPSLVRTIAGIRVGIIGLSPDPSASDHEARRQARLRAIATLRKDCDFLVVLSQLGRTEELTLLNDCGPRPPDLLIPGPDWGSGGLLIQYKGASIPPHFSRARRLGVVEVTPRAGNRPALRFRQIALDKTLAPDPEIEKLFN